MTDAPRPPGIRRLSYVELAAGLHVQRRIARLRPGPLAVLHRHECWEFTWLPAGSGHLVLPDRALRWQAPCGLVVPAGVPHALRADGGAEVPSVAVHADPARLLAGNLPPWSGGIAARVASGGPLADSLAQVSEIQQGPRWQSEAAALVLLVLARCGPEAAAPPPRDLVPATQRLLPALRWLDDHWREPVTADHLAGLCGVSAVHLRRIFLAATGMPPLRYARHVRMGFAAHILRPRAGTRRPLVATVAASAGFATEAAFVREFRRLLGVTPAAWAAGEALT
jgi:AraC-like DNA-binding protein